MKCAYCGKKTSKKNLTREHIPPKSFFLKGASNLITIPACFKCNNGKSSDDEVIKTTLLMTDLASINFAYKSKIDSIIRGILRPEKKHYLQALLNNSFTTKNFKRAVEIDNELICEWAGRNAQGLLFHEGKIKVCKYTHQTFWANLLKLESTEEMEYIKAILYVTKQTDPVIKGTSEFKYWLVEEGKNITVIQCFYEEMFFISLININLKPNE